MRVTQLASLAALTASAFIATSATAQPFAVDSFTIDNGGGTVTDALAADVDAEGIALVIVDTFAAFSPAQDENSATEVQDAVLPLRNISAAGAGVLLVHHPRKGGSDLIDGARGSGALPGAVDVTVSFDWHGERSTTNTRRVLRATGRYHGHPPEVVLDYTEDGYIVIGKASEARSISRAEAILSVLPQGAPGITAEDIKGIWPSQPSPGMRTILGELNKGASDNLWSRAGRGVKGDPFRFWRPQEGGVA